MILEMGLHLLSAIFDLKITIINIRSKTKQNETKIQHLYIYICLKINIKQTLAFTLLALLLYIFSHLLFRYFLNIHFT